MARHGNVRLALRVGGNMSFMRRGVVAAALTGAILIVGTIRADAEGSLSLDPASGPPGTPVTVTYHGNDPRCAPPSFAELGIQGVDEYLPLDRVRFVPPTEVHNIIELGPGDYVVQLFCNHDLVDQAALRIEADPATAIPLPGNFTG
jgi:hypothetical protein